MTGFAAFGRRAAPNRKGRTVSENTNCCGLRNDGSRAGIEVHEVIIVICEILIKEDIYIKKKKLKRDHEIAPFGQGSPDPGQVTNRRGHPPSRLLPRQ